MTDHANPLVEASVAIGDPGERDRSEQGWADRLVVGIGNIAAWLFPVLMVAICAQVVLRKTGHNQAWLDDAQWWIYGIAMTIGFAYAITTQSHVRVDILHQYFSPGKKARTEVFALGWLLLPFLLMMTDILFHYGWSSVLAREGSDSPNGLHRLYLLKMALPVIFLLAATAAVSIMIRHLRRIAPVRLWTILLAALPAAWFAAERLCYYALWGVIRWTRPDLNPRRIAREPLMEPTMWYGLAIVVLAIAASVWSTRRAAGEG